MWVISDWSVILPPEQVAQQTRNDSKHLIDDPAVEPKDYQSCLIILRCNQLKLSSHKQYTTDSRFRKYDFGLFSAVLRTKNIIYGVLCSKFAANFDGTIYNVHKIQYVEGFSSSCTRSPRATLRFVGQCPAESDVFVFSNTLLMITHRIKNKNGNIIVIFISRCGIVDKGSLI